MRLGNEEQLRGIQIAEDVNGRRFYNLNQGLDGFTARQQTETPPGGPQLSNAGPAEGVSGDASTPDLEINNPATDDKAATFSRSRASQLSGLAQ